MYNRDCHVISGAKEEDDPRPAKFRNNPSYTDNLFAATVNFTSQSGVDVSWRYAFGKADLQTAMQDHDYLEAPFGRY